MDDTIPRNPRTRTREETDRAVEALEAAQTAEDGYRRIVDMLTDILENPPVAPDLPPIVPGAKAVRDAVRPWTPQMELLHVANLLGKATMNASLYGSYAQSVRDYLDATVPDESEDED